MRAMWRDLVTITLGALAGGLGSVFVPWVNWGIEKTPAETPTSERIG